MQNDMTQGKVLPSLLRFCLPMLGAQLLSMVLVTVDALVCGRYIGEDALGAIGLTHSILFCVWGIFWGLSSGLGVAVGQYFGAKNEPKMRCAVTHGIMLFVALTALIMVISLPCLRWMLELIDTPPELMDYCLDYSYVMIGGLFVGEAYECEIAILRALGDAKTQLLLSAAAVVANIVLDLLCVLVFKWGVAGAAAATILTQLIQVIICLAMMLRSYPILRLKHSDWTTNWRMAWQILSQGLPMAMNYFIIGFGIMAVQAALNNCGSAAVNATALGGRVISYAWMPFGIMGSAVAAFVAQNYGANKIPRIFEAMKKGVLVELATWIVTVAILWPSAHWLVLCFLKEDSSTEIVPMAIYYVRVGLMSLPMVIVLLLFRHTMVGLGHASVSLVGGCVQMVARAAGSFLLAKYYGFEGVCYSELVAWTCESSVTSVAFWRWKRRYDRGLVKGFNAGSSDNDSPKPDTES